MRAPVLRHSLRLLLRPFVRTRHRRHDRRHARAAIRQQRDVQHYGEPRRLRLVFIVPQLGRLMERERITPRRDWQAQLEAVGFGFHSLDGAYWDESACYRFTADEVDVIEAATAELHEMSIAAIDKIVERGWIERYALERFGEFVTESWRAKDETLYG